LRGHQFGAPRTAVNELGYIESFHASNHALNVDTITGPTRTS
jgi:hypothetical protein